MIGIDIGGTKTAIARYAEGVVQLQTVPTPARDAAPQLGAWLDALIGPRGAGQRVTVSVPGVVRDNRVAVCDVVPALAAWEPQVSGVELHFVNDAIASLVGARALSGVRGRCLLLAAGTGIGGAFALDASLDTVMPLEPGYTPLCLTNEGASRLDDVASGRAICDSLACERSALPRRLLDGDVEAYAACKRAGQVLGRAIGGWINLFAPPQVLVVGGLANAAPYWEGVQLGVRQTQASELARCPVERVEYGAHAAVLGALALAANPSSAFEVRALHARALRLVVSSRDL